MSQDIGMPSTPSKSKITPSKAKDSHHSYSKSILGPYVPNPNPSLLPSILGPYIHPSTISMFSTSSPHAPNKYQQRHTSLNSFPCSPSITSPISSTYHLSSYTHTMANGSKLDAKDKVNQAKNLQKIQGSTCIL